ncbi:MAG: hypothetical protein JSR87_04450 [Proteobacteria bacterium]|nr:hypothetical protein [Pseudomonadota bacterium]MBS0573342.1 hypothetical protein [Pseudomonadota bacterium]
MAGEELIESRIDAGRWSGLVRLSGPSPGFAVMAGGSALPGLVEAPAGEGLVRLTLDLPGSVIAEGAQVFLVTQADGTEILGRFVLIAGDAVTGDPGSDLVAEVALLRAELDLLKAAFRRHCAATEA